ncbi:WD40 repeat domain-containing protein [Streptacidiphilus sp. N1-12]|uniref:WD40 repeat domain-containing protein n=2 Tax=Streptacidiphilus alkalitolerans TaxID=3342712 RepID=A0ABV6VHU3_9ACTN
MALKARRRRWIAVACIAVAALVSGTVVGVRLLSSSGAKAPLGSSGGAKVHLGVVVGLQVDDPVDALRFSPNGKLLAARLETGTVQLRNAATGVLLKSVGAPDAVGAGTYPTLAFSPDSGTIAIGAEPKNGASEVELISAATGKVTASVAVGAGEIHGLAYSPDGKTLAVAAGSELIFWNSATRATVSVATKQFDFTGDSIYVNYSADGKSLVDANNEGNVRLWDVVKNGFTKSTTLKAASVSGASVSRDGNTVVLSGNISGYKSNGAGYSNPEVWLWHPAGGTTTPVPITAPRNGAEDNVEEQALSPDGKLLATGDDFGAIALWSTDSGRLVANDQAPAAVLSISAMAYAPDGRSLATAQSSGRTATIQLWNLYSSSGHASGHGPASAPPNSSGPAEPPLRAGVYNVARKITTEGSWIVTLDSVQVAADGQTTFVFSATNTSTVAGQVSCAGSQAPLGASINLASGKVLNSTSAYCPDNPDQDAISVPSQSALRAYAVFANSQGLGQPFTLTWSGPSGLSGAAANVTLGSPAALSPSPSSPASAAGVTCGSVGTGPLGDPLRLVINSGQVTCAQAQRVLKDYRATKDRQGSGGFATVDGWSCGHNSIAGYGETHEFESCQHGSDQLSTVGTP